MNNHNTTHSALVNAILLRFGTEARLWKQHTGFDEEKRIHYGLKGSADITGILRGGRRVEIEVKTGSGRQSSQQRRFQAMIESMGGLYVLAHSVADVEAMLPHPPGR